MSILTDIEAALEAKLETYADPEGIWLMAIFESIGMDKVEGLRRYCLDAAFHALCHKISQLAAIAREAEAMCEWLASHDIVEKYEGGRRTYEFPEFTERGSQLRFNAALSAVGVWHEGAMRRDEV